MLEVLAPVPSPGTNKQIQRCLFSQRLEITQESLSNVRGRLATGPLLEELYSCLELDYSTVELSAHCQVFPGQVPHHFFDLTTVSSAVKWGLHIFHRIVMSAS